MSVEHQCVGTISLDGNANRDDHSSTVSAVEENGMTCMTMNATQQCRPLRPPVRVAWPSALLSGLQRALVAVFVIGALALASAGLLTVSRAQQPEAALQRIELPPVLVRAQRLPPAANAAVFSCPVPSDASAYDCPVPLDTIATQEF